MRCAATGNVRTQEAIEVLPVCCLRPVCGPQCDATRRCSRAQGQGPHAATRLVFKHRAVQIGRSPKLIAAVLEHREEGRFTLNTRGGWGGGGVGGGAVPRRHVSHAHSHRPIENGSDLSPIENGPSSQGCFERAPFRGASRFESGAARKRNGSVEEPPEPFSFASETSRSAATDLGI